MSEAEFASLDAAKIIGETAVGARAMSLVRMKRIGLSVPAAFCAAEVVFRQHSEQNNLIAQLRMAVDALEATKGQAKVSPVSDVRWAVIKVALAEPVAGR